jgi:glutathione peroxidase
VAAAMLKAIFGGGPSAAELAATKAGTAYDFTLRSIKGAPLPLKDVIGGKVALIVNVASNCGLTGHYRGLQVLQDTYGPKGFTVVGVPCNQFGAQEPGTEAEIEAGACTLYKTTFPMTSKVEVNGDGADPLYKWLSKYATTPHPPTRPPASDP